jgi:hypothetical protein
MRILLLAVIFALTVGLTAAAIEWLPQTLYFPRATLQAGAGLEIVFAERGKRDRGKCEKEAGRLAGLLRANCPACGITAACTSGLDASHRALLSRAPLPVPSARRADQALTIMFRAPDVALAAEACRQSAAAAAKLAERQRLTCYPAGAAR